MPRETGCTHDELLIVADRLSGRERQRVLHADPNVPACRQRSQHHRQRRPADAGRGEGRAGRERVDARDERLRGAGHPAGNAHHEVAVHVAAVRRAVLVEQAGHGGDVTEVEQLELRDDLAVAHLEVEALHEIPPVHEDVGAEVDRPAGQARGVRAGLEHRQAVGLAVGDRAAGRHLDDQVGRLAHGVERGADVAEVERGLRVGVADMHVDHGRTGRLAGPRGRDELLDGHGQARSVGFVGFCTSRCHADERPGCHVRHRVTTARREGATRAKAIPPGLSQTAQRVGGGCRWTEYIGRQLWHGGGPSMLKGDLTATPLAPLLLQLADESATGCLHISDLEGDEALIYFKGGLVYAVSVPGRRPQLGAKLVSSGELAPEALADALDAQRTELQGWRLGELLVHLGYVDQPVVEAFVKEQVHDALWDLIKWDEGRWRFRKNEKTREDVAPPMPVGDLLANLRDRGAEWESISTVVHGPTAVPMLSARGGGSPETTLDADAWSMLCKIDGERSAAELARDCGYTLFEAGQILVTLVKAGLVDIEEDVEVAAVAATPVTDDDEPYGVQGVASALAAGAAQDEAAVAVDEPDSAEDSSVEESDSAEDSSAEDGSGGSAAADEESADEFAALARLVSEVAAATRDDATVEPVDDDVYPVAPPSEERTEDDDVAAAVAAIASLSTARIEDELPASATPLHPLVDEETFAASIARVSSALADVLGPSPDADDPFEVPAELRVKKELKRDKKPARTPEMERRERLRNAAAAELAAAHALAEAIRAGQAEEKAVAEVVDLDQVRREAEEAAARRAAEEAELAAAEEAERAAAEEAARLAEEEAARIAAEEAARAAEEADRVATEEAARLVAEREAAEVEAWADYWQREADQAARREAEEAAARLAAEIAAAEEAAWAEYAERVAAEEEAARIAAEEEAARLAAEEEAARLAAEEEAARLAVEREHAEEEAWEEYWRREADLAAEAAEAAEAAAAAAFALAEVAAANDDVVVEPISDDDEPDAIALEFDVPQVAPEDPEVEAARREAVRAEMASATALLVELSAQSVDVPAQATAPDIAEVVATEDEVDDVDDVEEEQVAVGVGAMSGMTDTAALLRELSSLGVDDEAPAPAPAPRAPARPTPAAPQKKKRGLFGR
jgi:hypothetical protein